MQDPSQFHTCVGFSGEILQEGEKETSEKEVGEI